MTSFYIERLIFEIVNWNAYVFVLYGRLINKNIKRQELHRKCVAPVGHKCPIKALT